LFQRFELDLQLADFPLRRQLPHITCAAGKLPPLDKNLEMRDKARTSIELACHRVPGENADAKFCRSGCACKSFSVLKELCSDSTASM
jgi:hypothetical protein